MCVRYKFNFYYFYKPSRCLTRTGQFCVKTLVKNKLNQLLILGNSVTHLERLASQLDCLLVHCRRYLVDILGILNGWMDRWIVDIPAVLYQHTYILLMFVAPLRLLPF